MILESPNARRYAAILTADHAASSYGQPVLVVSLIGQEWSNPEPLGRDDVIGWRIIEASDQEARELDRAGYHLASSATL